ncbi:MAG: sigma-70 family RNA polymerase sigma factor, partial [Rhodanobacteraceae bacterium]
DSRLKAINGVADAGEQPDGSLARSQMHEVLEHEIGKLPESLRVVFVLRAVEEMSVKDTAQSLGISEATVRIRHFRARRLLRARIAGLVGSAKHDLFEFGDKDCDDMVANVLARLDVDRA